MQKLVQGVHQFQSNVFSSQRELFERLTARQEPEALFITCSDSRINPNLLTQTDPGDLFIIRNAGNLVPPYEAGNGGTRATIEFAVVGLNIRDIIICGHSNCGAMRALLNPERLEGMPAMTEWLSFSDPVRRLMKEKYAHLSPEALITATVEENVLLQLEYLRTHPPVAAGIAAGRIKLHGWVYKLETGDVFAFDHSLGQFVPLPEGTLPSVPASASIRTCQTGI